MNYLDPIILHILSSEIDNLIALRSFNSHGQGFFPSRAHSKRRYLTDDVEDLLVLVRGEEDWEAWVRVAIWVPSDGGSPEIFRPATYFAIEDFSSSDPGEPGSGPASRAISWANSL
ncbi:hypothetical protein ABIE41_003463 [Bosea sp. OAE506]|uniref:hypothetical protein n=1 Tax=Bosea sp. OAE506 TaxID=2663870 RepID=UPI00178ACA02